MAQYFGVALALCLIIVVVESGVLKSRQITLPDGVIVMGIAIRQKAADSEETSSIAKMKSETNGDDKKMTLYDAADQMPPGAVLEVREDDDFVPDIGSRSGIRVGRCPVGYVKRGGLCFPSK